MKYITQDIEAVQTIIKNDIPRIAVEVVRDILQGHGYELITDEAKYLYIFNNEGLIKAEDIVITDENRSILDDEYFEVISCCNTENSKDIVKLLSFTTDLLVSIEAADVNKGQGYNVNVFVNFANDNTTYLFINEVSSSEKIYSEYLHTFLDNYTGQINYIKNEGENSQEVTR